MPVPVWCEPSCNCADVSRSQLSRCHEVSAVITEQRPCAPPRSAISKRWRRHLMSAASLSRPRLSAALRPGRQKNTSSSRAGNLPRRPGRAGGETRDPGTIQLTPNHAPLGSGARIPRYARCRSDARKASRSRLSAALRSGQRWCSKRLRDNDGRRCRGVSLSEGFRSRCL